MRSPCTDRTPPPAPCRSAAQRSLAHTLPPRRTGIESPCRITHWLWFSTKAIPPSRDGYWSRSLAERFPADWPERLAEAMSPAASMRQAPLGAPQPPLRPAPVDASGRVARLQLIRDTVGDGVRIDQLDQHRITVAR